MHDKYLKGGSLNPFWVNDLQDQKISESISELAESFGELIMGLFELQNLQLEMESKQRENEYRNKLEIAYDFCKTHSETHEDKELCRIVVQAVG